MDWNGSATLNGFVRSKVAFMKAKIKKEELAIVERPEM